MTAMDPAVRKTTGYIAVWEVLLSLVMEAVFLIIGKWDLSVLFGNLGGAIIAVGNFMLLAMTVTRAVDSGDPAAAGKRVRATASLRLLGMGVLCALLIGLAKTDPFATLIPLLFPRIALGVRSLTGGKKAEPGSEGRELD